MGGKEKGRRDAAIFLSPCLRVSLSPCLLVSLSLWLIVIMERTSRIHCAFRVIIHSTIFSLSSGDTFWKDFGMGSFNP